MANCDNECIPFPHFLLKLNNWIIFLKPLSWKSMHCEFNKVTIMTISVQYETQKK